MNQKITTVFLIVEIPENEYYIEYIHGIYTCESNALEECKRLRSVRQFGSYEVREQVIKDHNEKLFYMY